MTRQGETTGFVPPAASETLRAKADALLPYTSHSIGCAIYQRSWVSGEPPCTCGLDDARQALAASPEQPASEAVGGGLDRYRHKVRGTEYDVLCSAELQDATGQGVEEGAILTIYRGDDGKVWARRAREFGDGRFERIAALAERSTRVDGDREAVAFDHLANVLFCDPGQKSTAAFKAARNWWNAQDRADREALAHPAESASDDDDEHPYEADGYLTIDHGPAESANCPVGGEAQAALVAHLRSTEHRGGYEHGGGSVSADGHISSWGGAKIMVLRNPDGPAAAALIEALAHPVVGGEALREALAPLMQRLADAEADPLPGDEPLTDEDAVCFPIGKLRAIRDALPPAGAGDVGYARGVEDAAKVAEDDAAEVYPTDHASREHLAACVRIATAIRALSARKDAQ